MKVTKETAKKWGIAAAVALCLLACATVIIYFVTGQTLADSFFSIFSWIYGMIRVLLIFDVKIYLAIGAIIGALFLYDRYNKHKKQ